MGWLTPTGWEKWIVRIDAMLDEDRYFFAVDTLEDIREYMIREEHVTPKQKQAIRNIESSVDGDEGDYS